MNTNPNEDLESDLLSMTSTPNPSSSSSPFNQHSTTPSKLSSTPAKSNKTSLFGGDDEDVDSDEDYHNSDNNSDDDGDDGDMAFGFNVSTPSSNNNGGGLFDKAPSSTSSKSNVFGDSNSNSNSNHLSPSSNDNGGGGLFDQAPSSTSSKSDVFGDSNSNSSFNANPNNTSDNYASDDDDDNKEDSENEAEEIRKQLQANTDYLEQVRLDSIRSADPTMDDDVGLDVDGESDNEMSDVLDLNPTSVTPSREPQPGGNDVMLDTDLSPSPVTLINVNPSLPSSSSPLPIYTSFPSASNLRTYSPQTTYSPSQSPIPTNRLIVGMGNPPPSPSPLKANFTNRVVPVIPTPILSQAQAQIQQTSLQQSQNRESLHASNQPKKEARNPFGQFSNVKKGGAGGKNIIFSSSSGAGSSSSASASASNVSKGKRDSGNAGSANGNGNGGGNGGESVVGGYAKPPGNSGMASANTNANATTETNMNAKATSRKSSTSFSNNHQLIQPSFKTQFNHSRSPSPSPSPSQTPSPAQSPLLSPTAITQLQTSSNNINTTHTNTNNNNANVISKQGQFQTITSPNPPSKQRSSNFFGMGGGGYWVYAISSLYFQSPPSSSQAQMQGQQQQQQVPMQKYQVFRRYTDFEALSNRLTIACPCIIFPVLPDKYISKFTDDNQSLEASESDIIERQADLVIYLNKLCALVYSSSSSNSSNNNDFTSSGVNNIIYTFLTHSSPLASIWAEVNDTVTQKTANLLHKTEDAIKVKLINKQIPLFNDTDSGVQQAITEEIKKCDALESVIYKIEGYTSLRFQSTDAAGSLGVEVRGWVNSGTSDFEFDGFSGRGGGDKFNQFNNNSNSSDDSNGDGDSSNSGNPWKYLSRTLITTSRTTKLKLRKVNACLLPFLSSSLLIPSIHRALRHRKHNLQLMLSSKREVENYGDIVCDMKNNTNRTSDGVHDLSVAERNLQSSRQQYITLTSNCNVQAIRIVSEIKRVEVEKRREWMGAVKVYASVEARGCESVRCEWERVRDLFISEIGE